MKHIPHILLFTILTQMSYCQNPSTNNSNHTISPIYSYTVTDIYGKDFSFEQLRGKKILVVNTASKCGLTPQYKELQSLYMKYKDKNFIIIGFPANNFLNQEPGTNETIAEFCEINYGVTFPMMAKVSVKGSDIAPIYSYLTNKSLNGYADSSIGWNFQKFAINEQGYLVHVFSPKTSPMDKSIIDWIEK